MSSNILAQLEGLFNAPVKLIPLVGYSNGNRDYQKAKTPTNGGWTNPSYRGLDEDEVDIYLHRNHWLGLLVPRGYIVVDIDDKKQGEYLANLIKILGLCAHIIRTPNGFQFVFKDTGAVNSQTAKMLTKGLFIVDYRVAEKGYIVLPTPNTENREWIHYELGGELSELPNWLEPLRRAKEGDEVDIPIRVGTRNDTLFRHACRLRDFIKDENEIRDIMEFVNGYLTEEPLETDELLEAIKPREGYDYELPERKEEKRESEKNAQIDKLYRLAQEAEIFSDQYGVSWATFQVGEHWETRQLRKKGFKSWLLNRYIETEGRPLSSIQALQSCIETLDGKVKPKKKVYNRIAYIDDKVYIDLADEDWNIVEISRDGWRVIRGNKDIKFRRSEGMEPLPIPEESEDGLGYLAEFVNLDEETAEQDLVLLIGFIIGCYSEGPYPILVLQGEQGSGKSTLSSLIKKLVDPSVSDLKALPDTERDVMVIAVNNYLLAFDNLAGITPKIADCLSRIATKGGITLRALYTDDEEAILDAKRPIILNGIEVGIERHDLLDRAILIQLPRLKDSERMDEQTFWKRFREVQPKILGHIFSAVAEGLRRIEGIKLDRLPRMADFTKWVVACEPKLPWGQGDFLRAYAENRDEIVETVLETDPLATAINKLLESQNEWTGTPTELFETFRRITEGLRDFDLPKSPKALGRRLKRSVTFLRQMGVNIEFERMHGGSRKRIIRIKRV